MAGVHPRTDVDADDGASWRFARRDRVGFGFVGFEDGRQPKRKG